MGKSCLPLIEESVSAVTSTNSVELGTIRYVDGQEYVYIYNTGDQMVYPKYGVTLASACASGYTCTLSSVTSVTPCFGVCVHKTITTETYGWVMKNGFTNIQLHADTGCTGIIGVVFSDNGVFSHQTNTVAGYSAGVCGWVTDDIDTGSGGTCWAYINCF